MAIAFVAAGTRTKADIGISGSPVNVALPAGHLSGHWLVLYVVTEDNTGPSTPSGWSFLGGFSPGASTSVPYVARPHVNMYHRIDNGALGSNVSVAFNTSAWPVGNPYVLAWIEAYSGVDNAGPVESVQGNSTTSTAAAHNHPTATTVTDQAWLLSLRAVGADTAKTFTITGGTNTERVDDSNGSPAAPSAASYSAGPLTPGAQTQRQTTASAVVQYGSVAVSLVIKPSGAVNATASPGTASGSVAAFNATVAVQNGTWELCGDAGLPEYSFKVDWDNQPTPVNDNWTFESTGAGWTAFGGATYQRSQAEAYEGMWSAELTTTGASQPRIESDKFPVVPERRYKASGYMKPLAALPSTASFSINWYDGSNVYISTSANPFTPLTGEWLYADGFYVAPVNAATGAVLMDIAGTPGAGIKVYGDLIRMDDDEDDDHFTRTDPSEETAPDIISEVSISYGRDQERQLSPSSVGSGSFNVINADRKYSPENVDSVLSGDLNPARDTKWTVTWNGNEYGLFRGRLDDFDVKADFGDRTVSFTFLDGLSLLQGVKLSTGVYQSMRTGELINTILDLVNWTGDRDIDLGSTIVPFWWVEGTDALSAVQDLVKSEGPPAVAYQAPDGTFVFRDRHHRLLRTESLASQATFAAAEINCASPAASGFDFTPPFTYAHGWRDIVNSVSFTVDERSPDLGTTAVWTSEETINLGIGQSREVDISTSDPFIQAITPVEGTDFIRTGAGTVNVLLSRDSGVSTRITLLAVGGSVGITSLQLRARSIPVRRSVKVLQTDPGSITAHGERTYPDEAPWANANDAFAIANMILLHYSQRRPTVQLRIVTQDPAHFLQVLLRTISDRIRITNGEAKLDDDFFVERVTHTITRFNQEGKAPIHTVTLGCEKQLTVTANPFRFDVRGAGFDDGVFDPLQADGATTVFIFDHPTQGQFDTGLYGT